MFDFSKIEDFDSHINQSIPNYSSLFSIFKSIAEHYAQPYSHVEDLGCSTGSFLHQLNKNKDTHYHGIDVVDFKNRKKGTITIVSSIAGYRGLPAGGAYCASKSGLELLSQVLKNESLNSNLRIFSIHPGIVDTPMQKHIRNCSKRNFPLVDKFIEYHKNNELVSAKLIAEKLNYLYKNQQNFDQKIPKPK